VITEFSGLNLETNRSGVSSLRRSTTCPKEKVVNKRSAVTIMQSLILVGYF
jgi:hypothetical protein